VLVELGVVEVGLREGEGVRDGFRGLAVEPCQALRQAVQRRERRPVPLAQAGKDVGVSARRIGGRGQEEAALRAESPDQGGRRQAGLAGHVGEGQARRPQPADGNKCGAEDVLVAGGSRSGHG